MTIPVKLDRSSFRNELESMAAEAEQTLRRSSRVLPGGNTLGGRTAVRDVERVGGDVVQGAADVGRDAEDAAQGVEKMTQSVSSGSDGVVGFGFNLIGLKSALLGVGIAILVTAAPAIAALGASLAGAAAAAGGMAVALAGVLGPAVLVALGPLLALGKVLAAVQAIRQAQNLKQTAQGHLQAANATLQHARAVTNLALAERTASREIRDSQHNQMVSQRSVADAQVNLQQTTIAAYRAWQDAIDAVSDSYRALEHARLDAESAKLDTEQAQLDLRRLRRELGLTGKSYDDMFKQFQDVRADPRAIGRLIAGMGDNLTEQNRIDLQRDIIKVKNAKIGEKDATNAVTDAERASTRARQDAQRYIEMGIRAYPAYIAAVHGLADAQWASARATEHYNDVLRNGVQNAPQVVAARDALRSATQALTAQTLAARTALQQVPREFRGIVNAIAGRGGLIDTFNAVSAPVRRAFGPVIEQAVRGARGVLLGFSGDIERLGGKMASGLASVFRGLEGPRSTNFFHEMFRDAGPLIDRMVPALEHLLGFFSHVAEAAMPALKRFAGFLEQTFGSWDRNTARGTSGFKRMTQIMSEGEKALEAWLRLIGAVGKLVLDFFHVTHGSSDGMLASLTKTVNKWDEWVNKNPSKIHDAIERARNILGDVASVLGEITRLLLALEPIAMDLFRAIEFIVTPFVKVMTGILNATKGLPAPAREFAGIFAGLVGVGGPLLIMKGLFSGFKAIAGGIGDRIGGWFSNSKGEGLLARLRRGIGGGAAAGEGVAAGGKTAAEEITAAMVEGGRLAGAEIAAAMEAAGATGSIPTFGGPKKKILSTAERDAATAAEGDAAATATGAATGVAEGAAAGGAVGGLRGLLSSKITGAGLLRAGVWVALGQAMVRGIADGVNNDQTLETVTGRKLTKWEAGISVWAKSSFEKIPIVGPGLMHLFGIPTDSDLAKAEEQGRKLDAINSEISARNIRHVQAAIRAGLTDPGGQHLRSNLPTQILDQLAVGLRNLGERAHGGLAVLRKNFNDVLTQIDQDVPRHSRSWSRLMGEAARRMIEGIARNVDKGRISVASGFEAMRETMNSKSIRGRDQAIKAFKEAADGIQRWLRDGKISVGTYTSQMDTITKDFLHRMHLRVADFTKSYRQAFANMIAAGVNADSALKSLKASQHFGGSEGAANSRGRSNSDLFPDRPGRRDDPRPGQSPSRDQADYWQKRGYRWDRRREAWVKIPGHRIGGVLGGYGGGDSVESMLEPGEAILRKEVVSRLGAATINALNSGVPGTTLSLSAAHLQTIGGAQGRPEQHNHFDIRTIEKTGRFDPVDAASKLSLLMRQRGL